MGLFFLFCLKKSMPLNWAWTAGSGGNREKGSSLLLWLYPAKHNKLLTALLVFQRCRKHLYLPSLPPAFYKFLLRVRKQVIFLILKDICLYKKNLYLTRLKTKTPQHNCNGELNIHCPPTLEVTHAQLLDTAVCVLSVKTLTVTLTLVFALKPMLPPFSEAFRVY